MRLGGRVRGERPPKPPFLEASEEGLVWSVPISSVGHDGVWTDVGENVSQVGVRQ